MTILERLKLELNNQQYYTDEQYTQFLTENNLTASSNYIKLDHQRKLLLTVIDILETISNDIDLMRKVADSTTGFTVENASKYLNERIEQLKKRVSTIIDSDDILSNQNVRPLFYKNRG